jgi:hypothetical protein
VHKVKILIRLLQSVEHPNKENVPIKLSSEENDFTVELLNEDNKKENVPISSIFTWAHRELESMLIRQELFHLGNVPGTEISMYFGVAHLGASLLGVTHNGWDEASVPFIYLAKPDAKDSSMVVYLGKQTVNICWSPYSLAIIHPPIDDPSSAYYGTEMIFAAMGSKFLPAKSLASGPFGFGGLF